MKKILLATTMLVGTAGFASAEISFAGSAAAGIATDMGLHARAYSSASLDVTFAGATDNGLDFGATFGLSVGQSYSFADDGGFAQEDSNFGMPNVYISGSFGKVEFSANEFDHFDDANGNGDVKYTGTFGAIGVGLIADIGSGNVSAAADATFGGIALHVDGDTYGEYNASAAYTMGAFTGTVAAGQSTVDDNTWSVKGEYAAGSLTASASYNDSAAIGVSLGYAANGISAGVDYGTDDDAATDDTYTLTAGYDLGGGLSLAAGYNYTGDAFVGAAMSF